MLSFRILLGTTLLVTPLTAQTRIAGVQVNRAFREYHLTRSSMQEFEQERAAIDGDPRRKDLEAMAIEARDTEKAMLRAAADDDNALLEARRRAELKRDELKALENALIESRNDRIADLNRRLVAATRRLLDAVRETATLVGRERGFDVVVDSSGHTNTGLPLVLYARNLPDLTNEVLARLNADAPAGPPAAEPAAAEPAAAQTPPPALAPEPDLAPPPTGAEYD